MTDTAPDLKAWIGRSQSETDLITPAPLRMLRATLDLPEPDAADAGAKALLPLWHWLFFLPSAPQAQIGPDGHPRRGSFLPPVSLPRRMWAGGQLSFAQPLHVGEAVTRQSFIDDVNLKHGRSGDLCFVRVRHEISGPRGLALREFHDIVYRPEPVPGAPAPAYETAPAGDWEETVTPDAVLLFRYSALTFNGHRIHYDRPYVTGTEGYPGLIVHGPLLATLLAGLAGRRHSGRRMLDFSFRALKPVFDLRPFTVCGRSVADGPCELWIRDPDGHVAMRAQCSFEA